MLKFQSRSSAILHGAVTGIYLLTSFMTQKLDSLTPKFLTNHAEITPKTWIALGTPLSAEVFNLLPFPSSSTLHNYQFLPGLPLGAKHLCLKKSNCGSEDTSLSRLSLKEGIVPSALSSPSGLLKLGNFRAPSHQAGCRTYCPFFSATSPCVADRLQVFAGCAEYISSAWTFVCSCPVLKSIALTRDRADKASCLLWEKLAEKWEAWKKPSCSVLLKGVTLMGTGLPGWAVSHPCESQRQTSKPKKHAESHHFCDTSVPYCTRKKHVEWWIKMKKIKTHVIFSAHIIRMWGTYLQC